MGCCCLFCLVVRLNAAPRWQATGLSAVTPIQSAEAEEGHGLRLHTTLQVLHATTTRLGAIAAARTSAAVVLLPSRLRRAATACLMLRLYSCRFSGGRERVRDWNGRCWAQGAGRWERRCERSCGTKHCRCGGARRGRARKERGCESRV